MEWKKRMRTNEQQQNTCDKLYEKWSAAATAFDSRDQVYELLGAPLVARVDCIEICYLLKNDKWNAWGVGILTHLTHVWTFSFVLPFCIDFREFYSYFLFTFTFSPSLSFSHSLSLSRSICICLYVLSPFGFLFHLSCLFFCLQNTKRLASILR